jgi:hypothetical protein
MDHSISGIALAIVWRLNKNATAELMPVALLEREFVGPVTQGGTYAQ